MRPLALALLLLLGACGADGPPERPEPAVVGLAEAFAVDPPL